MANLCYVEFSIIGDTNCVDEFIKELQKRSSIHDLDVTHGVYLEDSKHQIVSYVVGGFDCNWSLFWSIFYRRDLTKIIRENKLTIEMYSKERNVEEHYFIERGKTKVDDFIFVPIKGGFDWNFNLTDDYVERVHKHDRLVIVDGNV